MNYVAAEEFARIKANQTKRIALVARLKRLKRSRRFREEMTLAQKLDAVRVITTQIAATYTEEQP